MRLISYIVLILLWMGCKDQSVYSPKPRMYPRVVFPEKVIEHKDIPFCDFSFRNPSFTTIVQDQYFFGEEVIHPCWFDLKVDRLNADLHCSYYPINGEKELAGLVYDAFQVTNEHNKMANYIDERPISIPDHNVYGLLFSLEGPVASPIQFYLTDSVQHYFRASLYFNSRVNPDSTEVILNYLKPDIDTLITSFRWEE